MSAKTTGQALAELAADVFAEYWRANYPDGVKIGRSEWHENKLRARVLYACELLAERVDSLQDTKDTLAALSMRARLTHDMMPDAKDAAREAIVRELATMAGGA